MDWQAIGAALAAARRHLAANPDERIVDDSVARARLTSGLATVVEGSAGQRLTTDMPAALGGGGTAATPGWTLRAAVASCTATTIALRAAELGVTLTRLEVAVASRSDDAGMIGLDDAAPPGPLDATLAVSLAGDGVPPGQLDEIARWGIAHSAVADALARAVPLEVRVEIAPTGENTRA
jgi:uncharacterized OsmC-like protein